MKILRFILWLFLGISFKAAAFVGGGIVNPPPCAAGYLRQSFNVCVLDQALYTPVTTTVNSTTPFLNCEQSNSITSNGTGTPVGIKGVIVSANYSIQSTTAPEYVATEVNSYNTDSTCTATYAIYNFGYYNTLTTAGVTIGAGTQSSILYTNSRGQFYYQLMSAANGILKFIILGYVQ